MNRFLLNSTIAAITLLSASAALADDYNSGVVSKTPSGGYTEVEFGSGWYLRGDITYNIDGRSESGINVIAGVSGGIQTDYDDAVGARVGFGYYVTPNSRIEINAEGLFNSDFGGLGSATFAATDLSGAAVTAAGTREIEGSYTASNLVVNGYYDLPTLGTFTPYVGVGGGIGRINLNQTETLVCSPIVGVSCDFPAGGSGSEVSLTRNIDEQVWTYVYQLSLGTAIEVDDRTSLDLSYSYTGFGDGDEINYSDGTAVDTDGFRIHQIRAGLRYDIW